MRVDTVFQNQIIDHILFQNTTDKPWPGEYKQLGYATFYNLQEETMSLLQAIIVFFVHPILSLLIIVVFVRVILSWLISFNVINLHNRFVAAIWDISGRLTEPLIRPIRKLLPPLGGMDFSPIILLLALYFVRDWFLPGLLRGNLQVF